MRESWKTAGEARRERLSASLRANLRRRKAQARSRSEPGADAPETGAGEAEETDRTGGDMA